MRARAGAEEAARRGRRERAQQTKFSSAFFPHFGNGGGIRLVHLRTSEVVSSGSASADLAFDCEQASEEEEDVALCEIECSRKRDSEKDSGLKCTVM